MKPPLRFLLFLVLACIYKADAKAQISSKKIKLLIIERVKLLPETQAFFKDAKAANPIVLAEDGPSPNFNNYWAVQVGISNFDRLRTNFNFYVNPKTLEVYYLDNYTHDTSLQLITLQQWRQWRKTSAWKKPHQYGYRTHKLQLLNN